MNLKSYLYDRAPRFDESEIAPIHLADLNGRHYYAFAEDVTPPSGGKTVSDQELKDITSNSQLIRQIKEEAGRRITKSAPVWKQQNAFNGEHSELAFNNPDYEMFAKSFGAWGKIIKSPDELRPALEEAFKQDGPAIIAVPVDYRENLKLTKRLGELEFTI